MDWYLKVLKQHYADFNGRARRQEYWMFFLFNLIISVVLGFSGGMLVGMTGVETFGLLPMLYSLAVIIPGIALTVRRLHDTGKSGWFMLVSFIPLIGPLIMLYFMVVDSQPGNNEYGPNPKGA
ncbi:MAG: DUF805 domain-containing protein [Vulcanimicrobiota bacterium]